MVFGMLVCLTALTQKSAYPVVFGRYSLDLFALILTVFGLVVLLAALILIPRCTAWLSRRIEAFRQKPFWFRLPGCTGGIALTGWAMYTVLLKIPYPTLFLAMGAFFVCALTTAFAVYRPTSLRLQMHLMVFSILFPIAGVEYVLQFYQMAVVLYYGENSRNAGLKDYSQVHARYGEGGNLLPDLDEKMIGETGPVRIVTNSKGFRNDREFAYHPPPGVFRILYIGDSFVAGFRVDQNDMSGRILEVTLNDFLQNARLPYRQAEVLVAAVEEPARYWLYLQEYGFKYHPDLILVGICIGNDITQSYVAIDPQGKFEIVPGQAQAAPFIQSRADSSRIGFTTPPYSETFLPERARLYKTPLSLQLASMSDRLSNAQIGRRIDSFLGISEGIISWYGDSWYGDRYSTRPIHAFDPIHALGLFYTPAPALVDETFDRFFQILHGMHASAAVRDMPLATVLFPQRYQISQREWEATVAQYSLNPRVFDLDYANRRILAYCEEQGLPCFDLSPAMRKASTRYRKRLYMALGDMHWNALGHRVAGEAMAAYVWDHFLKPDALSAAKMNDE